MGIINAECGKTVRIAYQGENNRQQVRFDLADIMGEFPGGTAVLAILRSGDTDPVPAAEVELDTDGKALVWTVTAWECAVEGFVYAQVTYAVDDVVAKTRIWRFDVKNSLVVSAAEPEEWADLVGQLVTAAAGVNTAIEAAQEQLRQYVADAEAAERAAAQSATAAGTAQAAAETAKRAAEEAVGQYDDMTATATGLAAGSAPTAEIDHSGSAPVLRLGIPAGERGADGAQGPRGERGPAGPAGPKGDPGEAADVIDDTAAATDKTFSSSKLEQQREELLSAIERKFGIPNVGNGLNVSEDAGTGKITLNADVQQSDITNLKQNKADIIITNASGSIAAITDGADDLPVESMTVQIEPMQDLHGQSNPYPAGGGVNKWNPSESNPGYIGAEGNINAQNPTNMEYYTDYIPVLANTVYTVGYNAFASEDAPWISISWYTSDKTFISRVATLYYSFKNFTSPANAAYAMAGCRTFGHGLESCYFGEGTSTTFAPYENICPISGFTGVNVARTGKNLFDKSKTDTNNGFVESYYLNGTDGTKNGSSNYNISEYIPVKGNVDYVISAISGSNPGYVIYNGSKEKIASAKYNSLSSITFTTPANAQYIRISIPKANIDSIQLELGSSASSYEPYQGSTYPITFPGEAGTVYGGTLNPVTGKLIVTHGIADLGALTWGKISTPNGHWRFWAIVNGLDATKAIICSHYVQVNPSAQYMSTAVGIAEQMSGTNPIVMINDEDYANESAFTTAMSGVQLVYELATPVEYDLSDLPAIRTLLGYNAIFADVGDVSVDYRADTKLYIDNKITQAIAAALNA